MANTAEQKQLAAGPPVDYSFKDLKTVIDLVSVEPFSGTARRPALPPDQNPLDYLEHLAAQEQDAQDQDRDLDPLGRAPSHNPLGSPQGAGPGSGPGRSPGAGGPGSPGGGSPGKALGAKLNSNSLRLCNNHLLSLVGLGRVMRHVLDDPRQLVWLDVSSNQLAGIEDAVLEFPSLQVLYYHGNQISNINDVLKLQGLPRLTKLTLHGNPIAETKNYKSWVVAHLPGLRNMDFGPITRVERDKIDTWFRGTKKRGH
ncbi:hypothetical protein HYH03_017704 [Edaphochlamys debaryana]|uniref:Leucine-rich repeat-containing protein 51 n=1 Tax=Edaphochlamys debaryana TaxID=47281 RepID=A0A835XHH7_9CHLO|nr:hypothetical protein HYH03_017704 [Edaphochlamys debaryana]|eukprot:KAG2483450.1 hypothetical protein HYH03_017704 [Edaphochlamys debaryana]